MTDCLVCLFAPDFDQSVPDSPIVFLGSLARWLARLDRIFGIRLVHVFCHMKYKTSSSRPDDNKTEKELDLSFIFIVCVKNTVSGDDSSALGR